MGPRTPSLVGRRAELEQLRVALGSESWITIVGPGGVGKTTLTEAVLLGRVHERLELGTCRTIDDVACALAAHQGVNVERDPESFVRASIAALSAKEGLVLYLDECELLTPEAAHTIARLVRAKSLQVIATSRRPLDVDGESLIRLAPLQTDDAADLVAQLVVRAGGEPLEPDLATRFADLVLGLPLALRLVATRVASLGAEAVLHWFSDGKRFELHSALRVVVERSFSALPEKARLVLEALALFEGPIEIETALRAAALLDVDGVDALHVLVSHSLVLRSDPRYVGLFAWVKTYVAEQTLATERRGQIEKAWAESLLSARHETVDARQDYLRVHAPDFQKLLKHEDLDWSLRALEQYQEVRLRSHPTEMVQAADRIGAGFAPDDRRWGRLLAIQLSASRTLAPDLARRYATELDAALERHPDPYVAVLRQLHGLRVDYLDGPKVFVPACKRLLSTPTLSDEHRARAITFYAMAADVDDPACTERLEEAYRLYEKAGSHLGCVEILGGLAEVCIDRGEFDRALHYVELCRAQGVGLTRPVWVAYSEGAALFLTGDLEGARRALDLGRLDTEATTMRRLLVLRGFLYLALGDRGEAHEMFRIAQRSSGGNTRVLDCVNALGFALVTAEPTEWLERAVTILNEPTLLLVRELTYCVHETYRSLGMPIPAELSGRAVSRVRESILRALLHGLRRPVEVRVARDGSWFELRGKRIELPALSPLSHVLSTLAQTRGPVSSLDLLERAWPDERFNGESGLTRLRVTISRLRKMGLEEALVRAPEGGYALAPAVQVE